MLPLTEPAQNCLDRGINWITGHLDLFLPEDPSEPEQIKEMAELSILCGALTEWSPQLDAGHLARIQSHLVTFLSDEKLSQWVRKLPSFYSPYVVAYLPLRSVGIRIPNFEAALKRLHRAGYPSVLETTPYRELELQYQVWKAGLSAQPRWDAVYRKTALHRGGNPIYFSMDEVYSVTHTLFYLTDFVGNVCRLSEKQRLRAITVVEPLLVHYVRKLDWDLSSELLLNLIGLDHTDTPLFAAGLRSVSEAWRADGALPGPAFPSLPADATRKQFFERCYHTTLVGLLMCGAYLHHAVKKQDRQQVDHVTA